jgi:plastocyanin
MTTTSRNRPTSLPVLLGATLAVAAGALLTACGGQGGDGATAPRTTPRTAPAGAVDRVQIKDFLYVPAAITVPAGTTIAFTNSDSAPHTATSGRSPRPDGVFDSGTLAKGERRTVRLTRPGTFAYYCAIHPFMKGTVTVR